MEKFYIVKEGSRLYTDYWEWRNSVSENNKIVIGFFEQAVIATRLIVVFVTCYSARCEGHWDLMLVANCDGGYCNGEKSN